MQIDNILHALTSTQRLIAESDAFGDKRTLICMLDVLRDYAKRDDGSGFSSYIDDLLARHPDHADILLDELYAKLGVTTREALEAMLAPDLSARISFPTLSTVCADYLFPIDDDGSERSSECLDTKTYPASYTRRELLATVVNEALGNERTQAKDIAWRFYDIADGLSMHCSFGITADKLLCAIATIGDREVIFTSDC